MKKVALTKLKDGFGVQQAEPSPTMVRHLVKQMVKVDLSRIVNSFQLICISTTWLYPLYHTVILRARIFLKKGCHDTIRCSSWTNPEPTAPEVVGLYGWSYLLCVGLQEQTSAPAIDLLAPGWSRGFGILRFAL